MKTNYREILGMPKLINALGINSQKDDLNQKQKKAVKNIKYCANDQWQFVNGWIDTQDENAREYMLSPEELFINIYTDSLECVYDEGFCSFGHYSEMYLRDIRFCGKKFLKTVTLYFTAKLLEESIWEVEGTEEDSERIIKELLKLKEEIIAE